MPLLATALVGLLFLPGSVTAPVAQAKTLPTVAQASEEPSSKLVTPASTAVTKLTVRLTSYNAVPEQTDEDPTVTASGVSSNFEVIAARSHDLASTLPFGTVIAIYRNADDTPGCNYNLVKHLIGYRVIADTMNARFTKRVDVEFANDARVVVEGKRMNPARAMGVCSGVSIEVLGRLKLQDIPDTQEELAQVVSTTKQLALANKQLALSK